MNPPDDNEPLTVGWLIAHYTAADPALDSGPLAGVLDVDWARLEHAHGAATDIPALLRALLSPNADHREFALQLLFETVWHQGTIYSASAAVVPILINLLDCADAPGKAGFLYLIADVIQGKKELHWELDCYAAALAGMPAYLRLLDTPDREVAAFARHTLALLGDAAGATMPQLIARLGSDEEDMRGHTLLALDALAPPDAAGAALFELLLPQEPRTELRQIIALAIFRRRGERAAPEVVETVLSTCAALGSSLRHADGAWETDARSFPQPWQIDRTKDLADALVAAGPGLLQRALGVAADDEVAFHFALRLLDLVFGRTVRRAPSQHLRAGDGRRTIHYPLSADTTPLASSQLTRQQADALGMVLASHPFWQIESDLLGCYGLPTSREGLHAFLAGR